MYTRWKEGVKEAKSGTKEPHWVEVRLVALLLLGMMTSHAINEGDIGPLMSSTSHPCSD